jgi:hypothetical protein
LRGDARATDAQPQSRKGKHFHRKIPAFHTRCVPTGMTRSDKSESKDPYDECLRAALACKGKRKEAAARPSVQPSTVFHAHANSTDIERSLDTASEDNARCRKFTECYLSSTSVAHSPLRVQFHCSFFRCPATATRANQPPPAGSPPYRANLGHADEAARLCAIRRARAQEEDDEHV